MQRDFEEVEILECIKLCAIDKAPGPDGFSMNFYITFFFFDTGNVKLLHNFFGYDERGYHGNYALFP